MRTVYLNSESNSVSDSPAPETDYGIKHFDNQGMPANGMEEIEYPPLRSPRWVINREPYLDDRYFEHWPAPSIEGFLEMATILRRFTISDRVDRKTILIQHMAFTDTGLIIGDSAQFIYKFASEPSQIELYISVNGEITELNRFHQQKFKEVRIPLNAYGLEYMFKQVYGDLNRWNFNKFDKSMINNMTTKQSQLLNAFRESTATDEILFIDNAPILELLLSGAAGRIKRGEAGFNSPHKQYELKEDVEHIDEVIKYGMSIIFQRVNEKIKTREIALQFVLEELDAARQGDKTARKFAQESGFSEDEYIGAMDNSIEEVDGDYGPQQLLISLISEATKGDLTIMSKYKTKVIDEIMQYWSLGKYSSS